MGMIRPTAQRVDEVDRNTATELLEAFRRTGSAATEEVQQQQIAAARTPSDVQSTPCGWPIRQHGPIAWNAGKRGSMGQRILTDVSATVDPDRESELMAGFQELISGPVPDGLIRTDLLRGEDGRWRIQTVWRDREALGAVRAAPEPPLGSSTVSAPTPRCRSTKLHSSTFLRPPIVDSGSSGPK